MGSLLLFLFLIISFVGDDLGVVASDNNEEISFDQHYEVIFGDNNYVLPINQGKEVQLSMDNYSGSGLGSKMTYGSGFFHLMIKVPNRDSAGVVTAYYLSSKGERHDEIDIEFLGNREGKPYTLQTNIYADGHGSREQRLRLWFDPSSDFHSYRILWNQHQIVVFVDSTPIRVYKNKSNIGAGYPSKAMRIEATLWDGESWATNGGRSKINWSYAPFKAYFQGFDIRGCEVQTSSNTPHCSSDRFFWNRHNFWQLDPESQRLYESVKKMYMTYDYCADRSRFPTPPKEC